KTLTTASPFCRNLGHSTARCMCDVCDNFQGTPCSTNADCGKTCPAGTNIGASCTIDSECPGSACRGGTTCGGKRCAGGLNIGSPCTATSQCPSSTCTVLGTSSPRPNQCDGGDLDCAAGGTPGPNDGQCQSGPTDFFCVPNATMISCASDNDCEAVGVRSCV